jgi:hypothetical protein
MVLGKITGGGLILIGLAFIFVFPFGQKWQPTQFTKLGIFIGIFLVLLGIYLVSV